MSAQWPNHKASNLRPADGSTLYGSGLEQRGAVRVAMPFPVMVRGVDRTGDRFTLDSVLDNLSATGLYLRLARLMEPGAALFVVVRLSIALTQEAAVPGVAARGVVLRAEPQPGGTCGIAVRFTRHRFLYASTT